MIYQGVLELGVGANGRPGKTVLVKSFEDADYSYLIGMFGTDEQQLGETVIFSSIDGAYEALRDGLGDTMKIGPGEWDNNIVVDKSFITLEGVLSGYGRPDIVPTAGTALFVTTGQGIVVRSLRLVGQGIGGSGVIQQANGFTYEDCVIESELNHGMRLFPNLDDDSYTASEGLIKDCYIRDCGAAGLTFENPGPGDEGGVGPTDVVVQGCRFKGNTAQDILDVYAGGNDQTFTDCLITQCQFLTDKHGSSWIQLNNGTANTGMLSGNWFADHTGLTTTEIELAVGTCFTGNYDTTGIVDGSAF